MDDIRERLIVAAGAVFAAKGFEAATVREICGAANANIAAINYHFGDKQRLYIEAVKHAHCRMEATHAIPPGLAPAEALRGFIHGMTRAMHEDHGPPWANELVLREMARPTAACAELVESYIKPKFDLLLGIIDGLVPPGLPAARRHQLAFAVVGQVLLFRFHRPVGRMLVGDAEFLGYGTADLAEHVYRFSHAGIQAAAREASA